MSKTVTKRELVARIAEEAGVAKVVARDVIQLFLDSIIEELAHGNRLEFRDFGVFETRERAPRQAQNPRTMTPVEVPARRIVKFKTGRVMRERVRGDETEKKPSRAQDDLAARARSRRARGDDREDRDGLAASGGEA
jgi:integration host factor subunit beta